MSTLPHRICPRHEVIVLTPESISIPSDWALVPTEAELAAADRARDAMKADQRFFAHRDHFALCQEVQRSGGRL